MINIIVMIIVIIPLVIMVIIVAFIAKQGWMNGVPANAYKAAVVWFKLCCLVGRCYLRAFQSSPSCERAHMQIVMTRLIQPRLAIFKAPPASAPNTARPSMATAPPPRPRTVPTGTVAARSGVHWSPRLASHSHGC